MAPSLKTLSFDTELRSVQHLVEIARTNGSRYPSYLDIRPLVISLEIYLRDNLGVTNAEKRRALRIGILQILTKRNLESTYDVPISEAKTVQRFLFSGGEVTPGGEVVLIGLAKLLEGLGMEQS